MERENTPRIDVEELLRQARPLIRTVGTAVGAALAVGEIIRAKFNSTVNSLTFEKQLLARYNQLTSMGLTEEQAKTTLKQVLDNMVAKGKSPNQQERGETQ